MKRSYTVLIFFLSLNWIYSQITLIPDPCFEQNLIWVNVDSDGIINGQVATSDVKDLTELRLGYNCIKDLTGLQDFTSLKVLRFYSDSFNHELTSFDSALTPYLEELTFFYYPKLSNIKVDQARNLVYLSIHGTKISQIDLSQNENLTYLRLIGTEINSINLDQNLLLEEVHIIQGGIDKINVSYNTQLRILALHKLPFGEIDVSNNRELTQLSLSNCQISSLDVSHNPKLDILDVRDNQIKSIDVSQNPKLIQFECFNNQLFSLDVSYNNQLTNLECQDNKISSLNIESNDKLHIFQCSNNELKELFAKNGNNSNLDWFDATGNPELTCLEVDDADMGNEGSGIYEDWQIDPQVTYSNDCQYILGVDDELLSKEIKVFPNPADNSLNIGSENIVIEKIQIYNTLGQLLIETESQSIGVEELQKGLYFIRIYSEKGTAIRRFLKKGSNLN